MILKNKPIKEKDRRSDLLQKQHIPHLSHSPSRTYGYIERIQIELVGDVNIPYQSLPNDP